MREFRQITLPWIRDQKIEPGNLYKYLRFANREELSSVGLEYMGHHDAHSNGAHLNPSDNFLYLHHELGASILVKSNYYGKDNKAFISGTDDAVTEAVKSLEQIFEVELEEFVEVPQVAAAA